MKKRNTLMLLWILCFAIQMLTLGCLFRHDALGATWGLMTEFGTPATTSDHIVTSDGSSETKESQIAFDGVATNCFSGTGAWIACADGDVIGPAGATDNAIVRYDTTTGKLIQNSAVTVDDSGNIVTSGTVDGIDLSGIEPGADVTDATNVAAAGAVMATGNQSIDDVKTFTSFPITPSSAPTTDYQVANKKYVDDSGWVYTTQSTDPVNGDMSEGDWILNTTSGVWFVKLSDRMMQSPAWGTTLD